MAADASEGLGLRNTESRIAALKGVITFENHADGGLKIIVRVPLKSI
jgi:signal transduction histidine kinase